MSELPQEGCRARALDSRRNVNLSGAGPVDLVTR